MLWSGNANAFVVSTSCKGVHKLTNPYGNVSKDTFIEDLEWHYVGSDPANIISVDIIFSSHPNGRKRSFINRINLKRDTHKSFKITDKNTKTGLVSYNAYFSLQSGSYTGQIEDDEGFSYHWTAKCNGIQELRKIAGIKDSNTGSGNSSSGTAFFINSKGYLLTNNHVVEGCKQQKIKYNDKIYNAKIIAKDKSLDLSLMKIDIKPKNYINFSYAGIKKMEKIYVAGYPFGKGLSDDLKISSGIISSIKGFDDNSNEFQVDAPINPGNSGGPIVDDNGELVGIAVSGLSKSKSEGINFGIKSLSAINFLKINNIDPEKSFMTFGMNKKKLLNLLEESTVYTFCN